MKSDEINRYTRLKDLTKFGVDINWSVLSGKRVIIAGVGGIGSLAAEMLVRCGIGTIDLIDLDDVSVKNLNRLFYSSEDIGKSKVKVAKQKLSKINPTVKINTFHGDICSVDFIGTFKELLQSADLLLMGLDNITAREYVNTMCIRNKLTYIDVGASRSGLGGYVHRVIPFKTACYKCAASIKIGKQMRDADGEPCSASLPTTIAILASLQVSQALKTLLAYGSMPDYLTYNGLLDEFFIYKQKRDPNCPVCSEKAKVTEGEESEELQEIEDDEDLLNAIDSLSDKMSQSRYLPKEKGNKKIKKK
ncbi:MAG: hypothetical protein GF308_09995 [Candidatus Heimdallarchaeota archaeon]|nr:hypothetical protein [Candidatus Heimdallarchaeota archaeon]